MPSWFERQAEKRFGTPEKKARLMVWLVYISNLYVFFGILVLIWVLYGDHLLVLWDSLTK